MAEQVQQQARAQWGSRFGFILAAAGSAVGLGNIWKFPYITGENGGGLFVLIYLLCIALVGIPIMMSEIMIGRAAHRQPVAAFHALQGKRTPWASLGWLGVICGLIICSYYIVVAGWAMDYTLKSVVNFTKPIHDEAAMAASKYRATTSIENMRQTLIEQWVAHETRVPAAGIRAEAPPSVWRDFARYSAALGASGGAPDAHARLLADTSLAEHVRLAEQLNQRIGEVRATETEIARAHYESLSDAAVLDEAEALFRRNATFSRVNAAFGALATDGWTSTFWALVVMSITTLIVARGISGGIEAACRVLMPALMLLIVIMVIYGAFRPGFGEALSFVFKPDPSKLKPSGVLEALGHSFFTLSLGMGAMITYGSYQKSKEGLASQSVTIAGVDTCIALLACMMIFPIVFSYGQEPSAGPGLVFKSMPLAFAEIGRGGMLLAIMFFGLLVFAALTSSISLLEVVASYFIDERNWPRAKAAWLLGGLIFLLSIPSAFSNDPDMLMTGWSASFGQTFFDTMDYLASNWMLPLGGLFISIYAGWVMPKRLRDAEVEGLAPLLYSGWLLLVRFIAPALVIVVLLQKVGILDADELFHALF